MSHFQFERILLYHSRVPQDWVAALKAQAPHLMIETYPWQHSPDSPALALVWHPPAGLIAAHPEIKLIASLGAGVDHLLHDKNLPDIPILRLSDPALRQDMASFISMACLMLHRRFPDMLDQQQGHHYAPLAAPANEEVTIGFLGYGAMAKAAHAQLEAFGYRFRAWHTDEAPHQCLDPKTVKNSALRPGALIPQNSPAYYAGRAALADFLKDCDILVALLPHSPDTQNLIDERFLGQLKKGASLINAGRGSLIVEKHLIKALATGQLKSAFLDVFQQEPLAADSPLWTQKGLFLSPHSAALTRPKSAVSFILEQAARFEQGLAIAPLVDRLKGY